MRQSLIALFVLSTGLLISSPMMAATSNTPSPDEAKALCTKLTSQFEFLTPVKQGLPYWQKAKSEFDEGQKACENGKPVVGATAMQAAISDMYVTPDSL